MMSNDFIVSDCEDYLFKARTERTLTAWLWNLWIVDWTDSVSKYVNLSFEWLESSSIDLLADDDFAFYKNLGSGAEQPRVNDEI